MCYRVRRTCSSLPVIVAALGVFGCATADFCVRGNKPTLPSIDVVYAGKAFTVPAAGQCALWTGFCQSGCSPDNVQTGTACTASNGSHVSFGITTFYSPSNRQWDWIRLDLPGLSGFGNVNNFEEGFAKTVNYNASAVACNPSVGPVP
jgi:hypothetical protein